MQSAGVHLRRTNEVSYMYNTQPIKKFEYTFNQSVGEI